MSSPSTFAHSPRSLPLSAQEIERKLGSRDAVEEDNQSDLQRKSSRKLAIPVSPNPGSESDSAVSDAPSPTRPHAQPLPLSAISEASDGNASGSDSDSSSVGDGHSPRPPSRPLSAIDRNLDRLKLSAENTRMNDHSAVKSGYLMKKGERRKAWKKRWFVLRGGQVAMYKNDKEYRLLRLIPLSDIHACAPIALKKHSYTFGIVTPKRTYYVQADSDTEVMQWCATVERAKEEVKAGTTVTSLDTPRSEETPGGDKTPVELHSPPIPAGIAAIPIPLSVATSTAQVGGISESYNTSTTSTSPLTPFSPSAPSLLSSSYTTTSTAPTNAPAAPRVPPNSYAAGFTTAGAGSLGLQSSEGAALELDSLTAGLEQVVRTASFSSAGGASSVTDPEGGYFAHPPRLVLGATTGSPSRNPPPSPGGVVSSSEDDDGFDTAEPWISALPPVLHPSFPHEDRVVEQPTGFGDPNKVILAGYLMKQGKRKTWRKRWFVLMSGRLVYSRSHMDTKVHRQIPVQQILDAIEYAPASPVTTNRRPLSSSGPSSNSGAIASTSSTVDEGKRNYQHSFKIITPKRTYLVCAPSEEDEIKWLAALQCVVARKSTALPTSAPTSLPPLTFKSPPLHDSTMTESPSRSTALLSQPPAATVDNLQPATIHGRNRSVTDAGRAAVQEVEKRFHPGAGASVAG